jgi:hypothetical protein
LHRAVVDPDISLEDAYFMTKLELMWVVEVRPIWSENDLLRQLKLKGVELAVSCVHTLDRE